MKIGTAVFGVHLAVLCVFSLTQGCVTTESQGSGLGAGARHKGIVKHEHPGKASDAMTAKPSMFPEDYGQVDDMGWENEDPVITDIPTGFPLPGDPPAAASEIYLVQKGDILSRLAVDFDTTTAELVRLNGLSNPDVLYVGQELRVPAGRRGTAKSTTSKSTGSVKKGGTYTIKKGDTLSGIALAAGVSIDDLRSLNNIKGDMIMAGETLDIPSYGKIPAKKTQEERKSKKVESVPTPMPTPDAPAPAATELAPPPMADPAIGMYETAAMSVDTIDECILSPGETLEDLARQYSVSKAEIMRLNNISDESQVREGQRLRIPVAE